MKLHRIFAGLSLVAASVAVSPNFVLAITDQDVACSGGGTFSISLNEVMFGSSCSGSAVIPSGVTSIGHSAFLSSNITSVTIPASVTTIGNFAFYFTEHLVSVNFEAGSQLETIAPNAFEAAYALTSIDIPASVTSIGASAFRMTSSLISINFSSASQLTTLGNNVFEGASLLTTIDLPDTLTGIPANAFTDTLLSSINVPASVTSIGAFAFAYLTSFTEITFPSESSLTSIGDYAFTDTRLVDVSLPEGLTSIPTSAFQSVPTLTSIKIPSTVTSIGNNAFSDTPSLGSLLFPSGSMLTSIGNYAFLQSGLSSITLPASLTNIGAYAFHDLPNLSTIALLGDQPTVEDASAISYLTSIQKMIVRHSISSFGDLSSLPVWQSDGPQGDIPIVAGHTITFNANNAESGLAPQDAIAENGTNIILPGNFGELKLAGKQFIGWNTEPDGTGTSYEPDDIFTMPASDDTLYVRWGVRATPSVKPTISGTASVGSRLSANPGTWSGTPTPSLERQWYKCSTQITVARDSVPGTCAQISGAQGANLNLNSTHANKYIAIAVTGTSAGTDPTTWISRTSSKVTMRAEVTVKPTISGAARVGSTLTGNKGNWTGAPAPTFTYQWYACTSSSATPRSAIPNTCQRITGAGGTRLVISATYRNKYLAFAVIAKSGTTSATTWLSRTTAKIV